MIAGQDKVIDLQAQKIRVDSAACAEEKAGFRKALAAAAADRVRLNNRNNELVTKNETLAANLDECGSVKDTLTERVAQLEKQLKPNLVRRIGHAVRDGLAYVGGAAMVVGTLVLIAR